MLALLGSGFFIKTPTWQEINESTADKYPQIKEITADSLAVRLNQPSSTALLLRAAREAREFAKCLREGKTASPEKDSRAL